MTERERFEAWAVGNGHSTRKDDEGAYVHIGDYWYAWRCAWQAAKADSAPCCRGLAPISECYVSCGGTKPDPLRQSRDASRTEGR